MSKRLERMRSNPKADWKVADVEALCREFDVLIEPPRGGGSHFKVHLPGMREYVTVPSRRPIKPVYIRQVVQFIDAVRRHREHP
jgi:hypothetical protein